jgi:hypothetical protein
MVVAPYTLARCAAACARGGLQESVLTGDIYFTLILLAVYVYALP